MVSWVKNKKKTCEHSFERSTWCWGTHLLPLLWLSTLLGWWRVKHYYTLPQYISHQALILDCTVNYQKCMSKLQTLDNWEKFPISGEGIRTVAILRHTLDPPTHLSPPVWYDPFSLLLVDPSLNKPSPPQIKGRRWTSGEHAGATFSGCRVRAPQGANSYWLGSGLKLATCHHYSTWST